MARCPARILQAGEEIRLVPRLCYLQSPGLFWYNGIRLNTEGKNMNDLISVIVTCYNHEAYIEQCLRSIFKQTYRNLELIVLDDGSSDQSSSIIEAVLQDSPFPVTFEKQENMGVVETRNRSFQFLKGNFFLFVDSDNFLDSHYIEELFTVLKDTNYDIAYTDLFDPDKQDYYLISQDFNLLSFLTTSFIDNCCLIRSSILGDIKYDESLNYKKLEDYDFLLQLIIRQAAKPIYVPGVKLNYRVFASGSISKRHSNKYHYEIYLQILRKYLADCPNEIYQALSQNIFTLENRLDELIKHMDKVTDYVHDLEKDREIYEELQSNYRIIQSSLKQAEEERESLRNSLSYKLGNAIITPPKKIFYLLKHPILLKNYLLQLKNQGKRVLCSHYHPKKLINQFRRNLERSKILISPENRYLVYVIYESEESLQEYKILFLQALSKLSNHISIVINGSLSSKDLKILEEYGQVLQRENIGYDTAAFREGILSYTKEELAACNQLLLVNDTNIGPFTDLQTIFEQMEAKNLDFWGISMGEEQEDITGHNPYQYIPNHLQSYFLVIEKLLLSSPTFYHYWEELVDTDSRDKAIGKHETRFTKYFSDLGYRYDAVVRDGSDSGMYIHPLRMIRAGSPLLKYTALRNYDSHQFKWQGLERQSEIPDLLRYVREETNYPVAVLEEGIEKFRTVSRQQYILIIDGVENMIPQCTRYRVLNKAAQLRSLGFVVKIVNNSEFKLEQAQFASSIIIYRAPYSDVLAELCRLAKIDGKPVFFDIDDLVFDTLYTDQLNYTQNLSVVEKANYDANVLNYGRLLSLCDGVITSTNQLVEELRNYASTVLLNRNMVSQKLLQISQSVAKSDKRHDQCVRIGYFSGSISHNENFELVKPALKALMSDNERIELHIVGHLDIPNDMRSLKDRIVVHPYVEWSDLPTLIAQVDINLAPLVDSIFNRAKSEIKWLEAALVEVPTVASCIGSFQDMIVDGQIGLLAKENEWEEKLKLLILSQDLRKKIGRQAKDFVLKNCLLEGHKDQMVKYFEQEK